MATVATGRPLESARCVDCAYVLESLPNEGKCPECGRTYDLGQPSTFTRRPPFDRMRYWMPGLILAAALSSLCLAVVGWGLGNNGWAAWVGVPMAGGSVLGYRFRVGIPLLVLAVLTIALTMVLTALSLSLAGVFCAIVLSAVLAGPIVAGLVMGVLLRVIMKGTSWDQRWYLPLLAAAALPVAWAVLEGRPRPRVETVTTSLVIPASPEACFAAMAFYEEVEHEPPLLLRIGLAHPLGTVGSSKAVGDVKKCLYNKGHLTKQITEVVPGRKLAFRVVDQRIGYEHDVRLVDGCFEFEPAPGGTRVTVTTRYEPLLAPRAAWRWGEFWAVHTLHGHVLEGLRRRTREEEARSDRDPS